MLAGDQTPAQEILAGHIGVPTVLLSICINNTNSAHGFKILRSFLYPPLLRSPYRFPGSPWVNSNLGFDNKLYDQADYHSLNTSEMGGLMSVSWMRYLRLREVKPLAQGHRL